MKSSMNECSVMMISTAQNLKATQSTVEIVIIEQWSWKVAWFLKEHYCPARNHTTLHDHVLLLTFSTVYRNKVHIYVLTFREHPVIFFDVAMQSLPEKKFRLSKYSSRNWGRFYRQKFQSFSANNRIRGSRISFSYLTIYSFFWRLQNTEFVFASLGHFICFLDSLMLRKSILAIRATWARALLFLCCLP